MIVCPVCEHVQAHGGECAVCGKVFPRGTAREVPVERLPGLELTTLMPADRAVVGIAPMEGLERAAQPAAQVPMIPMLEALELHRAEPPALAQPTPAPASSGAITCRYCRNVQDVRVKGQVCDGCGMRLTRYMNGAPANASASPATASARAGEGPVVLHSCGVRTRAGDRCSSCGAHVPLPDER